MLASLLPIDAVRSRMKAERERSYGTAALSKQKWNGPLSRTHHSHRDLFIRACVPCGVWCDSERSLFFLLISTGSDHFYYFSRSFYLLLDRGYRISPASHTKRSVSAGTRFRRLLMFSGKRGTFTGQNRHNYAGLYTHTLSLSLSL